MRPALVPAWQDLKGGGGCVVSHLLDDGVWVTVLADTALEDVGAALRIVARKASLSWPPVRWYRLATCLVPCRAISQVTVAETPIQ